MVGYETTLKEEEAKKTENQGSKRKARKPGEFRDF